VPSVGGCITGMNWQICQPCKRELQEEGQRRMFDRTADFCEPAGV